MEKRDTQKVSYLKWSSQLWVIRFSDAPIWVTWACLFSPIIGYKVHDVIIFIYVTQITLRISNRKMLWHLISVVESLIKLALLICNRLTDIHNKPLPTQYISVLPSSVPFICSINGTNDDNIWFEYDVKNKFPIHLWTCLSLPENFKNWIPLICAIEYSRYYQNCHFSIYRA